MNDRQYTKLRKLIPQPAHY